MSLDQENAIRDYVARVEAAGGAPHFIHTLTPFLPFLADPTLNEIAVNRPLELWTEGRGWKDHAVPELSFPLLQQLSKYIAGFNKKVIDNAHPVLSAELPAGERIQIVWPPAAERETISMTIRKPSLLDRTVDDLEKAGSFELYDVKKKGITEAEQHLKAILDSGDIKRFLVEAVLMKLNIIVAGKTGSGKTTVLKALCNVIPDIERLITIEDVNEMRLPRHRNRVHLFFSREDEGGIVVTAKQALASCLRMKPDRILLSELRGDEAWEYVKSVNTGHPGSLSTMHANGAYDAFEQLATLVKDSKTGAHLDIEYIKHRLFTTIDVVLFYHDYKLREVYYDPEHKHARLG